MTTPHIDLEQVRTVALPVIEGAGYELVDLEWKNDLGSWVLRVYIDKPGGPHAPGRGITLDACADVSQELSTVLDVSEALPASVHYQLEVGSPGVDRPLTKPADFQRVTGHKVKLRTRRPLGEAPGRRNFAGMLTQVTGTNGSSILSIDVGDRTCEVPISEVEKANLVFEFKNNGRNR